MWRTAPPEALVVIAAYAGGLTCRTTRTTRTDEFRASWRMPSLAKLAPVRLSRASRTWMGLLRLYLVLAGGLVIARIVLLAVQR